MTAAAQLRGFADAIPKREPGKVPLGRQSILLYGEPKIGKTTEASKFPNPLFFDFERGTLNLAVPMVEQLLGRDPVTDPLRNWQDVLDATTALEKLEGMEGTLVIDTVPEAWKWARTHALAKLGIEHETDLGFGKGWASVTTEFDNWIRRIMALPYGHLFVTHVDDMEMESATAKWQKKAPRLDKGARKIIEPLVNMILYAENVREKGVTYRVMHTKGTDTITAGDRSGRLPELLPFSYEALAKAYEEAA